MSEDGKAVLMPPHGLLPGRARLKPKGENEMNKARRKMLQEAADFLYKAKDILEEVRDGEEEAYNNLPENLQYSERGEEMDGYVSTISDAFDSLEDMLSEIEEIAFT